MGAHRARRGGALGTWGDAGLALSVGHTEQIAVSAPPTLSGLGGRALDKRSGLVYKHLLVLLPGGLGRT
jgi:hypothetical protein